MGWKGDLPVNPCPGTLHNLTTSQHSPWTYILYLFNWNSEGYHYSRGTYLRAPSPRCKFKKKKKEKEKEKENSSATLEGSIFPPDGVRQVTYCCKLGTSVLCSRSPFTYTISLSLSFSGKAPESRSRGRGACYILVWYKRSSTKAFVRKVIATIYFRFFSFLSTLICFCHCNFFSFFLNFAPHLQTSSLSSCVQTKPNLGAPRGWRRGSERKKPRRQISNQPGAGSNLTNVITIIPRISLSVPWSGLWRALLRKY